MNRAASNGSPCFPAEAVWAIATVTLLLIGLAPDAAAQATATVAGSVNDSQGAIVAGAAVTLISETRGTTFQLLSGPTGDFVLTNVPGDTYTIRVTMSGFKKVERSSVLVVPGDRVAVGAITLEVGAVNETVEVSAAAPILQTQTGERSATVSQEAVNAIPTFSGGTFFAQAVALTPGVNVTSSNAPSRLDNVGNNTARTNYMLDGVTSVNTGGNQPGINLNYDSIAEVKVLTNTYSAEYGRSSGLQVIGVTKSGSNRFHGSFYDFENNSNWNTNSWQNTRNGVAKPVSKSRDWGGTIGGPVGKPGRDGRKLFFFISEQVQPTTIGGAVNYFRIPTLLERQGDFSQSTDQNGKLFNTLADASTGLPCTATNASGCFQDGGVLGRIPASRLYDLGLNILKSYPVPNLQGLNYNLQTVAPNVTTTIFQHVLRADYNLSKKIRISGKYAGQNTTITPVAGSIPGYNDRVTQFPGLIVPSVTVVYIINPSTVLEGSYGYTRGNQLGSVPTSAAANRCNVGLCDFPQLFPNAENVPKGSYQDKVLSAMKAPYYVNGRILLAPDYSWGTRISNPPPNNNYPPFLNWQYTNDINIAITKVWGRHTFKAGYQSQDSYKVQNLGTQTAGTLPVEGALSFANNSNNPLDTGFGYANAALGIFTSYAQQGPNMLEGIYVYHNKDFFVQDNWRISSKLTLDVGIRFVHNGPQYDSKLQEANFFPDKWSAANAPLLYIPGCAVNVAANAACPNASRLAVNPVTGASLGPGSSAAIGAIVPNTGSLTNGIVQAGKGIAKSNYTEPWLAPGPRVGVAYAPFSSQKKMVFRGGIGLFYDRTQGDSIFGQIGNPPVGLQSTVYNSTLQQVAAGGATQFQIPPQISVYNYDSGIPSSLQWNAGTQVALPWSSSLDVSYVGVYNYNSVAFGAIGTPSGGLPLDLNAPDLGTAYLPQYQDSTLGSGTVPGASALPTNLLRPYRGLGAIISTWPRFSTHYDSIQSSFNRQYRNGVLIGFNYTLGLRNSGNLLSPPQLQHLPNGSFQFSAGQSQLDSLISNVGLRRHILKGYFVWQLPKAQAAPKVVGALANGWQLSGVFTGGTGATYDATYSYQSNGANVNLTGSPQYAARIRVVGNPGSGCSSNPYTQFNVAAFAGPTYSSTGNESGSSLLHGCFDHTTNLSLARDFRLGSESRRIQFRVDAFNAFNAVVINGRQTQLQLASPGATAILNNQFNADGSLNQARLTPVNAGFGAATTAQAMRSIQLQFRFVF